MTCEAREKIALGDQQARVGLAPVVKSHVAETGTLERLWKYSVTESYRRRVWCTSRTEKTKPERRWAVVKARRDSSRVGDMLMVRRDRRESAVRSNVRSGSSCASSSRRISSGVSTSTSSSSPPRALHVLHWIAVQIHALDRMCERLVQDHDHRRAVPWSRNRFVPKTE